MTKQAKTKTIELPVIPREVAEGIEELRKQGATNWGILQLVHGAIFSEPDTNIQKWATEDGRMRDDFVIAVTVGYTVEQTPEEKVREYYDSFGHSPSALERKQGVLDTIELLGIKIKGVND